MYQVSYLARCPPNYYLSKELSLRVSLGHKLAIYLILYLAYPRLVSRLIKLVWLSFDLGYSLP